MMVTNPRPLQAMRPLEVSMSRISSVMSYLPIIYLQERLRNRMKIDICINWPLAACCLCHGRSCQPRQCLHHVAACTQSDLWQDVGRRVLKPFSHARLWKLKWFPKIFPQAISMIKALRQPPPYLCRTAHWFPWRLQTLGTDRWRVLADHGGPNCSLLNPDKALAMYKEIWTERIPLIFYKLVCECLIPLACPQSSSFLVSYLSWPFGYPLGGITGTWKSLCDFL
jgi:hypothetical protein